MINRRHNSRSKNFERKKKIYKSRQQEDIPKSFLGSSNALKRKRIRGAHPNILKTFFLRSYKSYCECRAQEWEKHSKNNSTKKKRIWPPWRGNDPQKATTAIISASLKRAGIVIYYVGWPLESHCAAPVSIMKRRQIANGRWWIRQCLYRIQCRRAVEQAPDRRVIRLCQSPASVLTTWHSIADCVPSTVNSIRPISLWYRVNTPLPSRSNAVIRYSTKGKAK